MAWRGRGVYTMYRVLTYAFTPFIYIRFRLRFLFDRDEALLLGERLGYPSFSRPKGPLLWFHAVSLGEAMAAIPLINCCIDRRSEFNILMTFTKVSSLKIIKSQLPKCVIFQLAPIDIPHAVASFLEYWKPSAVILMESELWPNLIMGVSEYRIPIALLNARISESSFMSWRTPIGLPLISSMLSKFSLITPLSSVQAIRFQLLQAPPFIVNFPGDLKLVIEDVISPLELERIKGLRSQILSRHVWMASSIHIGEEKVIIGTHRTLLQKYPDLVTIIVTRHPKHGRKLALDLHKDGLVTALRSHGEKLTPKINIYIVDTLGELRVLYRLSPIAVIGGSFLPGLSGHNISEAAAAGCAVLTGRHVGHFLHMIIKMKRLNPFSIFQVGGEKELVEAITAMFSDVEVLKMRQRAARETVSALSKGVVERSWSLLQFHVFKERSP